MACEAFVNIRFKTDSLKMIGTLNSIIAEYQSAGYVLTVRQLYYQCVARGIIENTLQSYKRLASLVNDARLAGKLDWNAIEDRTRDFIRRPSWGSGRSILQSCAEQFHMDMWKTQPRRVYVAVEKEALVGVLERVCHKYDVPLLAARGYPSASVLYDFAKKDLDACDGDPPLILHLGDHDPSGIDMSRDLIDRIDIFTYSMEFDLRRIALNMDQVEEKNPPPNPAKATDARFADYRRRFGRESWELDALPPDYLANLVTEHIEAEIDTEAWDARKGEIDNIRERIASVAKRF